jgi:small subunit ribosomal protein S16
MVVLRLKRFGRTHSPFFRLGAADKRAPRDGRVIEELGWYSPTAPEGKQWKVNEERIRHWLSVGAQPSETALMLLKRAGIEGGVGGKSRPSLAAKIQTARLKAPKKEKGAEDKKKK